MDEIWYMDEILIHGWDMIYGWIEEEGWEEENEEDDLGDILQHNFGLGGGPGRRMIIYSIWKLIYINIW